MDDITNLLETIMKSSEEVTLGGVPQKMKDAYTSIMGDIFDKGRHLATFYIAVHSVETLPAPIRKKAGNYIITPDIVEQFVALKSSVAMNKNDKKIV